MPDTIGEAAKQKSKQLVSLLFEEMNTQNIRYAIGRAYEQFPWFDGDIDMFVADNQTTQWEQIAQEVANKAGFDYIVYCSHNFTKKLDYYPFNALFHRTYYFYSVHPYTVLKIDLLNSLYFAKTPIFNKEEILKNAQQYGEASVSIASPIQNKIYSLTLLDTLILFPSSSAFQSLAPDFIKNYYQHKFEKKRASVLALLDSEQKTDYINEVIKKLGPAGNEIINNLVNENYNSFTSNMKNVKKFVLNKALVTTPASFLTAAIYHLISKLITTKNKAYRCASGRFNVCIENENQRTFLNNAISLLNTSFWTFINTPSPTAAESDHFTRCYFMSIAFNLTDTLENTDFNLEDDQNNMDGFLFEIMKRVLFQDHTVIPLKKEISP